MGKAKDKKEYVVINDDADWNYVGSLADVRQALEDHAQDYYGLADMEDIISNNTYQVYEIARECNIETDVKVTVEIS